VPLGDLPDGLAGLGLDLASVEGEGDLLGHRLFRRPVDSQCLWPPR
jgi:hypothetical protein